MEDLHKIADGLLEFETLTSEDIENLLTGQKIKKNVHSENSEGNKDADTKGKSSVPIAGKTNKNNAKSNNKNPKPNEA